MNNHLVSCAALLLLVLSSIIVGVQLERVLPRYTIYNATPGVIQVRGKDGYFHSDNKWSTIKSIHPIVRYMQLVDMQGKDIGIFDSYRGEMLYRHCLIPCGIDMQCTSTCRP